MRPPTFHGFFAGQIASRRSDRDRIRVTRPGPWYFGSPPDPTRPDLTHEDISNTSLPDPTRGLLKYLLIRPAGRVMIREKPRTSCVFLSRFFWGFQAGLQPSIYTHGFWKKKPLGFTPLRLERKKSGKKSYSIVQHGMFFFQFQ